MRKSEYVKGIFSGPIRVWAPGKKPWGPGLALSRAFGDRSSRNYGIISKPEIKIVNVNEEQKFFVMGSDGLFDKIEDEQAADLIE